MFLLDSLMIAGLRWTLETVTSAAEAELNDDTAAREALMDAAARREAGEISEPEYRDIERDLLARIRDIRERRDGGSGPIAFGSPAGSGAEASEGSRVRVEATVEGDFHDPVRHPDPPPAAPRRASVRRPAGRRRPARAR